MDLYLKLTEALHSPTRGDAMELVLRDAVALGLTPREALKVLERMYDEADASNNETHQNIIGDFAEIAKGYCQPQDRMWPEEETRANNAKSKSFWD